MMLKHIIFNFSKMFAAAAAAKSLQSCPTLSRMRLNKLHMIFVCDEKKNKIGIITMEDILEELVGDIQDESDTGEGLHLM